MAVYWLLAWGIVRLLSMGKPLSETEARYGLEQEG
jgi:hypothetical protein